MNKLPLALSLAFAVIVSMARFAEAGETVTLFDGKNLDAWVIENNGQFSVEGGVLRVNKGTGWLRSREEFGDFTLVMEFRFLEEGANSGVFVRTKATSNDDENGWPNNGYQVQCMDTIEGDHPLGTLILYGGPEFKQDYDLEVLGHAYKPAGEWQRFDIKCLGDTLTVRLNGGLVTVASGIGNSPAHIGIQGEHGLLEFRKIEVIRD
jgi:hypothetical protein